MVALAVTFFLAVYLLGPELLSRWVLGFVVPRKVVVQTRGEEVTRALVWAALPLAVSVGWAIWSGAWNRCGDSSDLQTFFSGLYSDAFFQGHRSQFFASVRTVFWMNFCLVWRLYLIIIVFSTALDMVVVKYRFLRERGWGRILTAVVAKVTLPRISEWHLLLSGMLMPRETLDLHADVLTKTGGLYQGRVQEKSLGPEGSLQTLTLTDPRRFEREQFHAKKKEDPATKVDDFWRPIPGNLFMIFGSDIANVNLRYIERNVIEANVLESEKEVLRRLMQRLTEPRST